MTLFLLGCVPQLTIFLLFFGVVSEKTKKKSNNNKNCLFSWCLLLLHMKQTPSKVIVIHTLLYLLLFPIYFCPIPLKNIFYVCCAENTILHQSSHINFGDCIFFCFFDLKNESRQKLMCFMLKESNSFIDYRWFE